MIFRLQRYSKICKIYCKNWEILNIRIFHSRDATIQNSIEKSFKKQLKNQWKLIEKRVQNQTPCRGSFLEPFWTHFGSILSPFSTRNRLFGAQSRPKWLPGGLWNTASIFIDFYAFFYIFPEAEGDAIWRQLICCGLEAKPLIFKKTLLGVESQRWLREWASEAWV